MYGRPRLLVRFEEARDRLTAEPTRATLDNDSRSTFNFDSDHVLSWMDAESLLEAYDFDVIPTNLPRDPDEAVEIADEHGYPVVLKVDSPAILHRTEADAVRTDLDSSDAVREAYERIVENARSFDSDANRTRGLRPAVRFRRCRSTHGCHRRSDISDRS